MPPAKRTACRQPFEMCLHLNDLIPFYESRGEKSRVQEVEKKGVEQREKSCVNSSQGFLFPSPLFTSCYRAFKQSGLKGSFRKEEAPEWVFVFAIDVYPKKWNT